MPDIGHVSVGLLAAGERKTLRSVAAFSALALLPDLDLVGHLFGVSNASIWGHRGFTHSLFFAALAGLLAVPVCRPLQLSAKRLAPLVFLVVASHGALDMLDTGSLGVAYLWPVDSHRYFWPLRFLPGPPPGENWLSWGGARVVLVGALWFLPVFALAFRPRAPGERP